MDILDSKLAPHPEAMITMVGDDAVILHLLNATYYGLDANGSAIWDGLQSGQLPRNICQSIAAKFDVDVAQVENDARNFLADLLEHNLVVKE